MRSIKLVPAVAAMALLALLPAVASAAKHPRIKRHTHAVRAGSCHIKANAAPRFIQSGESALVFGQLLCAGATGAGGQTVTVFQRSAAPPALTTVGTATTDPTGHFQLPTGALQTNSKFFATALGAKSDERPVKVAPKVSVAGPPDGSQLFTGAGPFRRAHGLLSNTVTFKGTVDPADTGAIVALQRENTVGNEDWHRIGHLSQVGPGGSFSISHTFGIPGDANIRVVVHRTPSNAAAASEPLSYEISQAENPALTIQSSADPIFYGQPVTISGAIASGPTPITLLARLRPLGKFVPVATIMSTSTGTGTSSYSFPETPLQNTVYRVTGAGKSSTHLFEGVKYGLTAGVSQTSALAGQPLVFSGTVTPGHVGHPVYLQAQGPSGLGYHVVDVGTVSAGSTYSIPYTLFVAGTKKLRIKVPGDPENQGTAGPTFPITVAPAPAAALTPEAPGNSTPPTEGHL